MNRSPLVSLKAAPASTAAVQGLRVLHVSLLGASLLAACLLAAGCAPRAVRGSDTPGLDDEAMSTGLDRKDLKDMLDQNMEALQKAAVIKRWEKEEKPRVAVLPIRNETSEHIDSALQALISDVETTLVNAGHVRVISLEGQGSMMEEVRRQNTSSGFDPAQVSRWGKQVGARYFVTGKCYSTDERFDGERRVQYYMFMQVLDAETGDILFQHKASPTKAIVR